MLIANLSKLLAYYVLLISLGVQINIGKYKRPLKNYIFKDIITCF